VLVIKERLRKRVTESLILILVYLDEWRRSSSRWLLLSLGCERGRERYRKIRSPAHEWPPPLSGRSKIAWRDSYLFPTEVDWNIFYRVGPHPRILLPFPELPPGAALSRRVETREQEARTWRIFYGKNGGSHPRSHPWTSCGDESRLELGICVTETHKKPKWMLRGPRFHEQNRTCVFSLPLL